MTQSQILKEFNALETDSRFISENAGELSRKYPKKFIAVYDNRLVSVGDSLEYVMEDLKRKGIEPSVALIEYIPGKGEIILY